MVLLLWPLMNFMITFKSELRSENILSIRNDLTLDTSTPRLRWRPTMISCKHVHAMNAQLYPSFI